MTAMMSASRYSRTTGRAAEEAPPVIEPSSGKEGEGRALLTESERAPPTGLGDEAERRPAEIRQLRAVPVPGAVGSLTAIGPVDGERPPEQIALRQLLPEAGVPGVVAVVAHAEIARRGDLERAEVVARRHLGRIEGRVVVRVLVHGVSAVVDQLAVDVEPLVDDADLVAADAYEALHHVDARILLRAQHHDVAAPRRPQRQQLALQLGRRRPVDEPIDE